MTEKRFVLDTNAVIFLTTSDVKNETIALRRAIKLKLPDCIVAATAIVLNAKLITFDSELLLLEWPGYDAKDLSK